MVSRYLIVTANEQTWTSNKPVLFLGEWCKQNKDKEFISSLDSKTLQYHWDDRTKLLKDYIFLQEVYEYFLELLTNKLNNYHGTEYSTKYWRILIGPWLNIYISIVFDRWKMLKIAIEEYEGLNVNIIKNPKNSSVPNDMHEFTKLWGTDEWNQSIYQDLIQDFFYSNLDIKEILVKDIEFDKNKRKKYIRLFNWKIFLKKFANSISYFFVKEKEVFIYSNSLTIFSQFILHLKLGQLPKFWKKDELSFLSKNGLKRDLILRGNKKEEFYLVLEKMIPKYIPFLYLEGYSDLKESIKNLKWPMHPLSIFTSDAFGFDDVFKAWTAEKVEKDNTPLIIAQHGGHYGIGSFSSTEEHELKVSNKYLSWGWNNILNKNIEEFGMINKLNNRISYKKKGSILLIQTTVPRYSYRLFSVPLASQWIKYFDYGVEFINCLPENLQNQVLVRTEQEDYGQDQENLWLERFPQLKIASTNEDIYTLYKKSKIIVSTYNSTSFLETLSRNIPTLVFWNTNYWEIREDARPYINLLKSVGIFHENPKDAAEHLVMISEDIESWWHSKDVQEVVVKFALRFAKNNNNLLDDLARTLKEKN